MTAQECAVHWTICIYCLFVCRSSLQHLAVSKKYLSSHRFSGSEIGMACWYLLPQLSHEVAVRVLAWAAVSERSAGRGLLPSSLKWLLAKFCSSWAVRFELHILPGCSLEASLIPCQLGLSVRQLASLTATEQESRKESPRRRLQLFFCNLITEVTSYHLCFTKVSD